VILPIVTDVTWHGPVCLSVCLSSVTLVHPAKAVGQNEMLFGRDTHVVSSNVLHRGPGLHGMGRFGGRNRQSEFTLQMRPNYCR